MPRKKSAKRAKTADAGKSAKPAETVTKSLTERWHDLAKRRLLSYVDLYHSGRWTLYYENPDQFAVRLVEVIATEKTWATLAGVSPATDDDLHPAAA